MLELRNVSKRYGGSLAVDNVSFRARPGEVTGYRGPGTLEREALQGLLSSAAESAVTLELWDSRFAASTDSFTRARSTDLPR